MKGQQNNISSEEKISFLFSLRYAAGSFGVGLLYSLANTYFIYFVTDVALVPAGIMGTVFLVTRVFDFCCTPIIAGMIQNTSSRIGKYRAWMLYILPVTSVSTLFCFTKITGAPLWTAFYYGVAYLLAYGLLDKPSGAQKALMSHIAKNDEERMILTARTAQMETFANIVFSLIAVPLLGIIGKGNESRGFFGLALIFAIIGYFSFIITAHACKPFDVYSDSEKTLEEKIPASTLIHSVFSNPPLIFSMLIEMCKYIALMVFVSTMAHYFKYVIKDFSAITPVMTVGTIVAFISSLVAPQITKRIGKKNAGILAMSLQCVAMLLARFFLIGNVLFFGFCICLLYFGSALQICVGIVMFSKAADYYQYKTGYSIHGFVMANYVFPVEVGIAVSAPLVGWFLASMNYNPTLDLTAKQIEGMQNLVLLIPGLIFALATLLSVMHPLSEKRLREISSDLKM